MSALAQENALLLLFVLVLGAVPALADALKARLPVPNLIVGLVVGLIATLTSPIWIANTLLDAALTAYLLLAVPAILIIYLGTRVIVAIVRSIFLTLHT